MVFFSGTVTPKRQRKGGADVKTEVAAEVSNLLKGQEAILPARCQRRRNVVRRRLCDNPSWQFESPRFGEIQSCCSNDCLENQADQRVTKTTSTVCATTTNSHSENIVLEREPPPYSKNKNIPSMFVYVMNIYVLNANYPPLCFNQRAQIKTNADKLFVTGTY